MIAVGFFVCRCGHRKASHLPHGGSPRRKHPIPESPWLCRKSGCPCEQYAPNRIEIEAAPLPP